VGTAPAAGAATTSHSACVTGSAVPPATVASMPSSGRLPSATSRSVCDNSSPGSSGGSVHSSALSALAGATPSGRCMLTARPSGSTSSAFVPAALTVTVKGEPRRTTACGLRTRSRTGAGARPDGIGSGVPTSGGSTGVGDGSMPGPGTGKSGSGPHSPSWRSKFLTSLCSATARFAPPSARAGATGGSRRLSSRAERSRRRTTTASRRGATMMCSFWVPAAGGGKTQGLAAAKMEVRLQ